MNDDLNYSFRPFLFMCWYISDEKQKLLGFPPEWKDACSPGIHKNYWEDVRPTEMIYLWEQTGHNTLMLWEEQQHTTAFSQIYCVTTQGGMTHKKKSWPAHIKKKPSVFKHKQGGLHLCKRSELLCPAVIRQYWSGKGPKDTHCILEVSVKAVENCYC